MNDMQIGRVGIVGAVGVGAGIAARLLEAGVPVTLFDSDRMALDAAAAPAAAGHGRQQALLAATVHFHHLKDCDLIIDAAAIDGAGREALFRRLDQVARWGAVLATCTPEAGLDRLAACTRRPGDVLGLRVRGAAAADAPWQAVPGKATAGASLDMLGALGARLRRAAGPACAERGVTALAA